MKISTRGRYALRVMIDLAENDNGSFLPMKAVAARQGISLKYLERILPVLSKNGLIEGVHGKGGGYRLKISPEKCTVGEVLRLTEGNMAPVSCLECGKSECDRASECRTLDMWMEFYKIMSDYFDGVTVKDLMKK